MEITEREESRLCRHMEAISALEYHDCAGQKGFTQGYFGTSIMYGGVDGTNDSVSWIFPEKRDIHTFVHRVMVFVLGLDKAEEFADIIQVSRVGHMYVLTGAGLKYKHH